MSLFYRVLSTQVSKQVHGEFEKKKLRKLEPKPIKISKTTRTYAAHIFMMRFPLHA